MVFDSALNFSAHVDSIAKRALRRLGFVCRISREFSNPVSLLKLYLSVVLPILEYAYVVWNGTCQSNSNILDKVQNKFISIHKHRFSRHSVNGSDFFTSNPLQSLKSRRTNADRIFLFKLVHGIISLFGVACKCKS